MRNQIAPRIGDAPTGRLTREDVELFVTVSIRDGPAPKTVGHVVGLLHSICGFAIRRGWMAGENPCRYVDRPQYIRRTELLPGISNPTRRISVFVGRRVEPLLYRYVGGPSRIADPGLAGVREQGAQS